MSIFSKEITREALKKSSKIFDLWEKELREREEEQKLELKDILETEKLSPWIYPSGGKLDNLILAFRHFYLRVESGSSLWVRLVGNPYLFDFCYAPPKTKGMRALYRIDEETATLVKSMEKDYKFGKKIAFNCFDKGEDEDGLIPKLKFIETGLMVSDLISTEIKNPGKRESTITKISRSGMGMSTKYHVEAYGDVEDFSPQESTVIKILFSKKKEVTREEGVWVPLLYDEILKRDSEKLRKELGIK
jgi:hypothetical protein